MLTSAATSTHSPNHITQAAFIHCAEVCSVRPSGLNETVIHSVGYFGPNFEGRHGLVAKGCLQYLHGLRRDICQLQSLRSTKQLDAKELEERIRLYITPTLRHACQRWAYHLSLTRYDDDAAYSLLYTFLTRHLLHWVEVLSLLGKVDIAAPLLELAVSWLHERNTRLNDLGDESCDLMRTAIRFIQAFRDPIVARGCHVYTALAFSRTEGPLHRVYNTDGAGNLPGATMRWTRYLVRFLGVQIMDLSDKLTNAEFSPRGSIGGGYSDVYCLKVHPNGPVVAIKALRPVGIDTGSPVGLNRLCKRLLREVKLGASLNHPHVAQVSGFAIIHDKPALVSPWCKHGNIRKYLQERSPKLTSDRRLELLLQVADGLRYLHSHDPVVVHGDLKADNVLVNDEEEAQLCDFGLSRFVDDPQLAVFFTSKGSNGTTRWCAPEILAEEGLCNQRSDIYSFACLGIEIMIDQIPFAGIGSDFNIMKAIGAGCSPIPQDYREPPALAGLWDLLRRCWLAPGERPTIHEVCDKLSLFTRQQSTPLRMVRRR
ncbi:hypothetical protein FRB95_012904 [Tulasnella sp. JGI-2019a]|nr:hypothetical protein FRB95_012904 [Tulasnella sp. JGI-2019a]